RLGGLLLADAHEVELLLALDDRRFAEHLLHRHAGAGGAPRAGVARHHDQDELVRVRGDRLRLVQLEPGDVLLRGGPRRQQEEREREGRPHRAAPQSRGLAANPLVTSRAAISSRVTRRRSNFTTASGFNGSICTSSMPGVFWSIAPICLATPRSLTASTVVCSWWRFCSASTAIAASCSGRRSATQILARPLSRTATAEKFRREKV